MILPCVPATALHTILMPMFDPIAVAHGRVVIDYFRIGCASGDGAIAALYRQVHGLPADAAADSLSIERWAASIAAAVPSK